MAVGWGSDTGSTQLTTISTEQFFSQTPNPDPNEYVVLQIVGNSSGTTDSLVISVYATLDAATENWDTVAVYSVTLDCTDGADNDITFVVKDLYKFRVGVARDGSTDTFTADMSHRVATMS